MFNRPIRTPKRMKYRTCEGQHEETLAEEPLAHLELGFFEGDVEPAALADGEDGEEEVVGVFAFKHEVDAEEDGGEEIEDVGEPQGERGKDVGAEFAGEPLCLGGDLVYAELVRQR
jgi:hypothetical protein